MQLDKIINNKALRITLIYLLFGSLWILLSDRIVDNLFGNSAIITSIQTYKGWFYVLITGLIFYHLISREFKTRSVAETFLRESEERYKTLADLTFEGVLIHDNGVIIDFNKSLQEIIGYQSEDLVGINIIENLVVDDYRQLVYEKLKSDTLIPYEFEIYNKNNNRIWMEGVAKNIEYKGSPARVVALRDITWRKKAELELRESKEQFSRLIEASPVGITILRDGKSIYNNNAAAVLFGFRVPSVLFGTHLLDRIAPSERDRVLEISKNREIGGDVPVQYETVGLRDDGLTFPMLVNATLAELPGGTSTIAFLTDLTYRKNAEEKIKESEHRFKTLSDLALEGILLLHNGIGIDCNEAFCQIYGYSREELLGIDLAPLLMEGKYLEETRELIKQKEWASRIIECVHKTGKKLWIEDTAKVIEVDNKKVQVVYVKDITWKVEVESALKQSEEKYKRLVDNAPDVIYRIQIKPFPILEYISPQIEVMTGYSPKNFMDDKELWLKFIHHEDLHLVDETINAGKDDKPIIMRWITKDGKKVWVENRISFFNDEDGLQYLEGIAQDITSQKLGEDTLRENEERHRILSEATSDFVYSVEIDQEGLWSFKWISGAFEKVSGYSPEEINKLPFRWKRLVHPEDLNGDFLRMTQDLSKNLEGVYKYRIITKPGAVRWLQDTTKPILDSKTKKVVRVLGAVQDITEKVIAEEEIINYRVHLETLVAERTLELQDLNIQLTSEIDKQKVAEKKVKEALRKEKELNELKSGFLSMASHEFRTPLTAILSSADILSIAAENNNYEKINKHINKIKNSISTMTSLLDDVILVGRSDSKQIKIKYEEVDVVELAYNIISDLKNHPDYNHNVELDIEADKLLIKIDSKLYRQILDNLLTNAVKYTDFGTRIILKIKLADSTLISQIEDEGPGIANEELKKIFEPFYRIHPEKKISGSGLGLAIVNQSVEKLGGKLSTISQLSKGTKFIIEIPIKL
ncbi:MAG: PAS domain S-box protein [Bacteroidetes bacterium]|nr:PAS domain S-box protein [Bacteroidota bacterium]